VNLCGKRDGGPTGPPHMILLQKLDEEQLAGNNLIGTNNFLNQHCRLAPDLESIARSGAQNRFATEST
jgi:hypothetical protein